MRLLERALGTALFLRRGKRVSMTSFELGDGWAAPQSRALTASALHSRIHRRGVAPMA